MGKRNLMLTVSLGIVALVAVVILILGYVLSGADVIAWLGSKYAITIYVIVGIYALIVLFMILMERNRRL